MLFAIHRFIKKHQRVSFSEIERTFQIDKHALQPMMALLLKKQYILKVEAGCQTCHGCLQGCATIRPVYYESLE